MGIGDREAVSANEGTPCPKRNLGYMIRRLRGAGECGIDMEPIDYTGALRRSWRLLLVAAVLVAVIAVLLPVSKAPGKGGLRFQASALVGAVPAGKGSPLGGGISSSQIYFYASTQVVQNATVKSVHLDYPKTVNLTAAIVPPGTLSPKTVSSASLKRNSASNVLLTGYGRTRHDAEALANAYAYQVGSAVAKQAEMRAAAEAAAETGRSSSAADSAASAASDPSAALASTGFQMLHLAWFATHTGSKTSLGSSRKVRLLAGLVIGVLLGAGIVLLRELLDKRIRNASRAASNFGFPVVVEIPALPMRPGQVGSGMPVDVVSQPDSAGAEAYRMLRMSVLFEALAPTAAPLDPYAASDLGKVNEWGFPGLQPARAESALGPRDVIMVVSAGAEPSRPHVAANLVAIYGEAGQRVIVVSTGDIEAGLPLDHRGVRPRVIRREDVEAALQPSRLEFVHRLPMSAFVANSGELVTRGRAVLDAARTLCDVVVVEVPPLLAVHHAEALSRAVDAVLVVGECGFTTFGDARRAGDLLRRIDAPVLGVVLTNVRFDPKDVRLTVARRIAPEPEPQPQPQPPEREAVLVLGPGPATSVSDAASG